MGSPGAHPRLPFSPNRFRLAQHRQSASSSQAAETIAGHRLGAERHIRLPKADTTATKRVAKPTTKYVHQMGDGGCGVDGPGGERDGGGDADDVGEWDARADGARRLCAEDVPVTTVAFDLGYDSVSAFIALFKRTLGVTPSAYFAPR